VTARLSTLFVLVGALLIVSAPDASAQPGGAPGEKEAPAPPPPTPEQLEQAKQAFIAGKGLFDDKKFEEAAEKFKESYRLSRNPLLLYNVAFTFDQMNQKEMAVFYYKKFLSDAPAEAPQRPDATTRLKVLEKELEKAAPPGDTLPPGDTPPGDGGKKPRKPPADPSSFTAADFEHQVIEDAPPGKPLDLTAFAPEDSAWIVTMYYRGAGDAKFTAVQMKPRYNELVARVPAKKMTGVSIQYYLEVRTPDAKIVTRIGRPASPNLVYIDPKARPRYYPDLTDERDWEPDTGGGGGGDVGGGGGGGGDTSFVPGGYTTVGSKKFKRAKWAATGAGLGSLTISLSFYLLAANMSSSLEAEAASSNDDDACDADPLPCRRFNSDRQAIQTAGERNELVSRVAFGAFVVTAGVAGWYWYKEVKAEKSGKSAAATKTGLDSLVAAPVVGEDFFGGAAALRF
jgi:hypothetical protein